MSLISIAHFAYNAKEGYDFDVLRQFVNLFPSSALASLLKGYLLYTGYNLTSNEHEEGEDVAEDADGLDLILVSSLGWLDLI